MATKFSDEQLLRFKQAGFSAEEISLFEFNPSYAPTEEELDALIGTNAIAETLAILPKNLNRLFEHIELTYGVLLDEDLPKEELEKRVKLIAKQNPEYARQLVALLSLTEYVIQNEE